MSSPSSPQVLVVGSGPSGLLLALALLQNGVSVRIIERDAVHHAGERGSGIMVSFGICPPSSLGDKTKPRTLEIEHFLGVESEVREAGVSLPLPIHIFDPQDPYRIMKSMPMTEDVPETPAFPITQGMMIGQWLHQTILRKKIESLGAHVELGCSLSSLEQQEDGVVAHIVRTVNGKPVEEDAEFSYVVGADGARSTVRKSLGLSFVGETREEGRLYIVDAHLEGMEGAKGFYAWGDANTATFHLRTTTEPGIFQLLFSGPQADLETLKAAASVEAVQNELVRISGRKDLKVTQITWQGEWRPNMRIASRFHVGRVFIVGDAAHAHSPTGGQGLNSSIQDSFNLAWKLALVLKGHTSPKLLDSFEDERLPVIAEMLNLTTDLYHKTFRESTQQAFHTAESIAPVDRDERYFRGRKLFQLDLNYRWSSIVFDERFEKESANGNAYGVPGQDVRAGDRAPDAPGLVHLNAKEGECSITRLFDVFHPTCHTALIFTSNPSDSATHALLHALEKLPAGLFQAALILPKTALNEDAKALSMRADFVFKDAEGHAYEGYGLDADAESPAVYIIRPDAMIGAFARSSAGVDEYLSAVFNVA